MVFNIKSMKISYYQNNIVKYLILTLDLAIIETK